ncbi:MAG: dNTP triphosphohydrolase [Sedimentisphaerales bacterium]|nr:dNTP triphosphohydrolase [Sedimentisphaerales bacterium]
MSDGLQSYAVKEAVSKGRAFSEPPHPYRSDFERDRDRIIHSSAFRRLEGKTQVLSPGLDDYYRSRLTHSIEVAQIGRTIAKVLGLNENLTEAICLGHDLGHPPFGHSGEQVLNELMAGYGGFEHNAQTLRIVTLLEHPYPAFLGLNLMYETRLGLAKHNSPYDLSEDRSFAEANCTLEGQVADVADRIAYNCHDLEDGLRARLIDGNQMRHVQIYTDATKKVGVERIPDWTIRRTRTAKTITDRLVSDCIDTSHRQIADAGIQTPCQACDRAEDLVRLSDESDGLLAELERFLYADFYHHEKLVTAAQRARGWLTELFEQLCRDPQRMPGYFRDFIPEHGLHRVVCDYIAGMTDRYCLKRLGVTAS